MRVWRLLVVAGASVSVGYTLGSLVRSAVEPHVEEEKLAVYTVLADDRCSIFALSVDANPPYTYKYFAYCQPGVLTLHEVEDEL